MPIADRCFRVPEHRLGLGSLGQIDEAHQSQVSTVLESSNTEICRDSVRGFKNPCDITPLALSSYAAKLSRAFRRKRLAVCGSGGRGFKSPHPPWRKRLRVNDLWPLRVSHHLPSCGRL